MIDPPMWLYTYRTKEAAVQVSHYTHTGMFREAYDPHYFDYWLASNERLEDKAANNKLAKA
jgi:hypothetical protein